MNSDLPRNQISVQTLLRTPTPVPTSFRTIHQAHLAFLRQFFINLIISWYNHQPATNPVTSSLPFSSSSLSNPTAVLVFQSNFRSHTDLYFSYSPCKISLLQVRTVQPVSIASGCTLLIANLSASLNTVQPVSNASNHALLTSNVPAIATTSESNTDSVHIIHT